MVRGYPDVVEWILDLCLAVVRCRNRTNTGHLGHTFLGSNGHSFIYIYPSSMYLGIPPGDILTKQCRIHNKLDISVISTDDCRSP